MAIEFPIDPTANQYAWLNPQNRERAKLCTKPILCTAGLSYFVLRANGSVTRCYHDLKPIGTPAQFLSGEITPDGPMPCEVGKICDSSGDQMHVAIWDSGVFQEGRTTRWRESHIPERAQRKIVYSNVIVSDLCNFTCAYCCNYYPDPGDDRPSDKRLEPHVWDQWIEFLKRNYAQIQLNVNGGEPLTWTPLADKLDALRDDPQFIEVSLNSNLSMTSRVERLPSAPAPRAWRVSSSIHPVTPQFDFKRYLESARILMDKGWWVRAVVVSWDKNIEWWDQHAQEVRDAGIDLWLKPVGGYKMTREFWGEVAKRNGGFWKTPDYLDSIGWTQKPPKVRTNWFAFADSGGLTGRPEDEK